MRWRMSSRNWKLLFRVLMNTQRSLVCRSFISLYVDVFVTHFLCVFFLVCMYRGTFQEGFKGSFKDVSRCLFSFILVLATRVFVSRIYQYISQPYILLCYHTQPLFHIPNPCRSRFCQVTCVLICMV